VPLFVEFPSWLKPEIIPGFPIRWYGLMYIIAFSVAWLLYRRQVKERHFPITENQLSGLFFWGILALVAGARIFSTLVYETSSIYRENPLLIFWPFRDGKFTGLLGMSYHGGVIGGLLAIFIYTAVQRLDPREIGDMFAAGIPLGYTAGRLGNFINGELFGRITTSPLGMIFPAAQEYSLHEGWVREIAEKTGLAAGLSSGYINLPRHPSQLYEALFEGIVLWAIIWLLRNKKPFKGFLVGIYLIGYGFFRFIIEYFREPDTDLGYRIEFVKTGAPPALFTSPWNFSTGQILSFVMILAGLLWLLFMSRMPDKEPVRIYGETKSIEEQKTGERRNKRRLKKKLRG
jgi:phosphatidylglycerol:prolipoprotein diacylglycerol transferase